MTRAVSWRAPTGSDRESLLVVEKGIDMYDGKCFRVDFDRVTGRVGVPDMLLSIKEAPIIFVLETQ